MGTIFAGIRYAADGFVTFFYYSYNHPSSRCTFRRVFVGLPVRAPAILWVLLASLRLVEWTELKGRAVHDCSTDSALFGEGRKENIQRSTMRIMIFMYPNPFATRSTACPGRIRGGGVQAARYQWICHGDVVHRKRVRGCFTLFMHHCTFSDAATPVYG